MPKVLVLYYSTYGHIETMAEAVAEGAREAGAEVTIKRVPELVPEEVAKKSHFKLDQKAPIATVDELANDDAIIIGVGTRFGRMASQMANFLDQAGGLWMRGALHGKVGGAFTSTATQHGGQEMTLFSIIANLLHFGMMVIGLDYGFAGQMTLNEITGGSPYGATTIAAGDGSRRPSANELAGARYEGRKIAEAAKKLHGLGREPVFNFVRKGGTANGPSFSGNVALGTMRPGASFPRGQRTCGLAKARATRASFIGSAEQETRACPDGKRRADSRAKANGRNGGAAPTLRKPPGTRARRGIRRRFRSFRRSEDRSSRRGEPRHLRVLPGSCRYHARADLNHGFNIVAVETDWPDAARIDRFVRHRDAGAVG